MKNDLMCQLNFNTILTQNVLDYSEYFKIATKHAPDEGLFVLDAIPQLSTKDILNLRDKPYWQTAMLVA